MSLLREDLKEYTGASNLAFNEKIKKLKVHKKPKIKCEGQQQKSVIRSH